MIRIIVCGGRDYANETRVHEVLNHIMETKGIRMIAEGGANGADTFAARWAAATCTPCLRVPADWNRHGRSAGPLRNRKMLEMVRPDMVVAFPGGNGTADMVKAAREAGVGVMEIDVTVPGEPEAPQFPGQPRDADAR